MRVHSGASGALLYTHAGAASGDYMGFAVARLGDVDGDFVDDFLAGAPQGAIPGRFDVPSFGLAGLHPAGVGYVDVCSGATGSVIRTHTGTGIRQDFGREVTGTPDLDGDGVADYAVGAPYTGPWAGGYVKVYSGATGTVLFTLSKATTGAYERFGAAISAGGDVDGDGTPDLAIGAPGRYGNWGRVEIWSGATGQLLESRNSPATPPQALVGPRGEHYGNALAWLGDLDGDGTDELAVGAPYPWVEFESIGRVEVISPLVPPSPFPRPTWFGSGCPVSSIPLHPSISVSETPQSAGSPNFSVLLDIAPPLSQATLIIGFSNTSWLGNALPLSLAPAGAPGCQLLVSADATVSATTAPVHAWSRSSVSLPIPPTPSLAGAVVYFQWYVTDPGFVSGVAGSGVSAGLMVTIH